MKILFSSAVLPYPLHSGGQIRLYNLLKILSKKHEIHFYSFIRDIEENVQLPQLSFLKRVDTVYRGHAWQPRYVIPSIMSYQSLLFTTYMNTLMRQKLTSALNQETYDLIHIEPSYVAPSLPKNTIPLIVAEHNIEYSVYESYVRQFPIVPMRPFLYWDVLKLRRQEIGVWNRACHVITVSADDANVVRNHIGTKPVSVIPNGVDLTAIPFIEKKMNRKSPVFLFVGQFTWMQNRDALKYLLTDIWPNIKNQFPSSILRIVGKKIPYELRNLIDRQSAIYVENVDQITDEYKKADIMLAPIRIGGGTKFKIIESMASGLPVITTTIGAKGLKIHSGREVMIADGVSSTLESVNILVTSPALYKEITHQARECIKDHYSWKHIAAKLDSVWRQTYEETH